MSTSLPDGKDLESAMVAAKEGRLSGPDFAQALAGATLMLAVTDREAGDSGDAALPFVIEVEGAMYGVAFTSPSQWDTFKAQTPFILISGRDLGHWPDSLGLVINGGSEPSMMLTPSQLAQLVGSAAATQTVPAGTTVRVGAPEAGLSGEAVEALRQGVRSQPTVRAAYEFVLSQGDAAPELVIGVVAEPPHARVAQEFAAHMERSDPQFGKVAFLDLNESLLQTVKKHANPIT